MKFYSEEEFEDRNVESVDYSIDEVVDRLREYETENGLSMESYYLGGSGSRQYAKDKLLKSSVK